MTDGNVSGAYFVSVNLGVYFGGMENDEKETTAGPAGAEPVDVANINSLATLNLLHQQVALLPCVLIPVNATSRIRESIPLPSFKARGPLFPY